MSTLGERIKYSRESKGLLQSELATLVGVKSSGVISNWEKDINKPDAEKIVKLCDVLDISASFLLDYYGKSTFEAKPAEINHIKKYRALDSHGKKMVDFTLQEEWERSTAKPDLESKPSSSTAEVIPMRFLSYYQRMASAGRGEYLFSDIPTDVIAVPDTPLSRKADFVIGVNGRSMEDTYFDGDKVLVEKTQDVPIGEIGIFIRGSECFIKEAGKDRLISHNADKEQYPDIIPDERRIDAIGIVLGKVGD